MAPVHLRLCGLIMLPFSTRTKSIHTFMKPTLTLLAALALSISGFAQTFSDDFESYSAGDYIAQSSTDWDTWNGTTGGTLDCQVVDTEASSGSNSLYLFNTMPTGGPMDLILPFGGAHNTGQFSLSMSLFVEEDKGGYINFQKEVAPGTTWALHCWFNDLGEFRVISGGIPVVLEQFEHNVWFDVRFDIDLNTNTWELFIDDEHVGAWANPENQIASMNLYPVNGEYGGNNQSGYYVDDVSYDYTPYTAGGLNGTVTNINMHGYLASVDVAPMVTVRNLGTTDITSVSLSVEHAGGSINQTFGGLSIAPLATQRLQMTDVLTRSSSDFEVTGTVSDVNGLGQDDDANDDTKVLPVDFVAPAPDKIIVVEEGTGTWCQWCPRGAVMMDSMTARYQEHLIGIAVHNGDPMVHAEYDAGLGGLISGYPSATVSRIGDLNPLDIEGDFLVRVAEPAAGRLTLGAESISTTELNVSLSTEWLEAVPAGWKVAVAITEDHLSGTTSDWNQSNAYAGGLQGWMGGYELLPASVPASQMVYDHVARLIAPSFEGYGEHFANGTATVGDVRTLNVLLTIDADWDINNMHVIGMLIDTSGSINNGVSGTITEIVNAGFVQGEPVSVESVRLPDAFSATLAPNPASDYAMASVVLDKPAEVALRLLTIDGRVVGQRNYGIVNSTVQLPIQVSQLEAGIYLVELTSGNERSVQKLIVR